MAGRYAWRERVKTKFFNPYRAVPSLLISAAQFVWKRQPKTSFTELWIVLSITVAAYLILFVLESLWRFVVLTPPKIYREQTEVIGDLHGQVSAFQEPEISPTEQRRRDQVQAWWQSLTRDEKAVVQFIYDRGDTDAMTFNESGLNGDALRSAVQKTLKWGLILYRREKIPVASPYLPNVNETYWVNPQLRDALEFVLSQQP